MHHRLHGIPLNTQQTGVTGIGAPFNGSSHNPARWNVVQAYLLISLIPMRPRDNI